MKKIIVFGVLLFFIVSFAAGCGEEKAAAKSEKAAKEAAGATEDKEAGEGAAEGTEAVEEEADVVAEAPPKKTAEEVKKAEPQPVKPAAKQETQPEPEQTERTDAYSDFKVAKLVKNARERVKSYSFYYQTSANWDLMRDQYFIKGDIVKISLFEENMWDTNNYFDTVYLNLKEKTASGYCENPEKRRCKNRAREFSVNFDDYKIITPLEWVDLIESDAKWLSTEQVDSRPADVVEYKRSDGNMVRIWMDKYSGIPVQVVTYKDEIENILERYRFRELAINSVKTADVTHQI